MLFYLILGLMVIPLVGPQQDETLFWRGLLDPKYVHSTSHRNPDVSFMLMPYIGALKIWLYKPVAKIWGASLWSMRIPVLLLCAASIWLTFIAARRYIHPIWAAAGAWLLAADPIYLWTGTFDWGPVALQHFLALTLVCCAIQAHETGSWRWAALAGLSAGLGVWDKVSFLWILCSLAAALLVTLRPADFRPWLSPRAVAAFVLGVGLGALVFIRYNLRADWATFSSSAGLEWNLPSKLHGLWLALSGSGLFGFLVKDSGKPGFPGWSILPAAAALGLAMALAVKTTRKTAAFLTAAMGVGFLLMAVMKNAGESAHHIVLLWPLPHLLAAAGMAALWTLGRGAKAAAAVCFSAVLASSLLVNARYVSLARNEGPGDQWTLASRDLAEELERRKPPAIFVVDWGILDPLRLQGRGRLPLLPASDAVTGDLQNLPGDSRLERLKDPSTLVVTHPGPLLNFPGYNERLDEWARENGLAKEPVAEVRDSRGVTQFEIYRYVARR